MTTQEKVILGKHKVGEIDFSREIFIWMTIMGLILSVIGVFVSILLLLFLGIIKLPGEFQISIDPVSPLIVMLIIGCFHEGIHGLVFRLYGKDVRYGFKLMYNVIPVFYTYSKGIFTRNQLIIVCLAPCILITGVLSIILMTTLNQNLIWISLFLITIILAHLTGCCGDFYITYRLLKFPPTVSVENAGGEDDPFIIWNDSELKSLNQSIIPQTWIIPRFLKLVLRYGRIVASVLCLFFLSVLLEFTILGLLLPIILMPLMTKELQLSGFRYTKSSNGLEISLVHPWELLLVSVLVTIVIYVSYRKIFSFTRKKSCENDIDDSFENAGIPFFI